MDRSSKIFSKHKEIRSAQKKHAHVLIQGMKLMIKLVNIISDVCFLLETVVDKDSRLHYEKHGT